MNFSCLGPLRSCGKDGSSKLSSDAKWKQQRHHIYVFNLSSKQFSHLLPVFLEKAQIQFDLASG